MVCLIRLLPDCIMQMDIVSGWRMFPPPRILKQAYKSTRQAQYYQLDMLNRNQQIAQAHIASIEQKLECWYGQILCDGPMCTVDWSLRQKPLSASQQQLLRLWTREFPVEKQLLACYWALIQTATMSKSHKAISKPEIVMMSCLMSDEHSSGKGSAPKSFIIKWKWLMQDHTAQEIEEETLKSREALFPQN